MSILEKGKTIKTKKKTHGFLNVITTVLFFLKLSHI